jgi:molybdopterin-guanine dinucleotide biosynthesis protein A
MTTASTPDGPAGPAAGAYAAVVLSGGTGRRLGGTDKAGLRLGGGTLLARALDAVAGADEVVVVGPETPTAYPVVFVLEHPPGGGPAAGLIAGLLALEGRHARVVVLAVDMPYVAAETVARLLEALGPDADGAFLADPDGRRQLAGVLRPDRLTISGDPHGLPLHRLLAGLELTPVPTTGREALDVDTWEDVRDLRVPHSP